MHTRNRTQLLGLGIIVLVTTVLFIHQMYLGWDSSILYNLTAIYATLSWIGSVALAVSFTKIDARRLTESRIDTLNLKNTQFKTIVFAFYHDFKSSVSELDFWTRELLDTDIISAVENPDILPAICDNIDKQHTLLDRISQWARTAITDSDMQIKTINPTGLLRKLYRENTSVVIGDLGIVTCNQELFEMLLSNLVENGLKHNHRVDTQKWVGVFREGSTIIVEDNGEGFDDANLSEFVKPFVKSRSDKGEGIGLFICDTICQLHGWTLDASANAETGSRFKINMK